MSKWDDLLSEEPSIHHEKNVIAAAQTALTKNRDLARANRRSVTWWTWGLTTASLLLVGSSLYFGKKSDLGKEDFGLLAFQEEVEVEDLDLLAEEHFDLELLDNLDFLEEMEEA